MGQRVPPRNRPARSCGLTSPDRSPRPQAPNGPQTAKPAPPAGTLDKPQNSQRQETHDRHQPQDQLPGPAVRKRSPEFPRWIEAKAPAPRIARAPYFPRPNPGAEAYAATVADILLTGIAANPATDAGQRSVDPGSLEPGLLVTFVRRLTVVKAGSMELDLI
jgi:hypothetical protein